MSLVSSITMPAPGAPLAQFQAVAELLNSIPVTTDQVERGYAVLVDAHEDANGMPALVAFAESEGLTPSDVAAQAIRVRAYQAIDALSDGVDLKKDAPDMYEAIMMGPIYPGDLGYFPVEEDDEDGWAQ